MRMRSSSLLLLLLGRVFSFLGFLPLWFRTTAATKNVIFLSPPSHYVQQQDHQDSGATTPVLTSRGLGASPYETGAPSLGLLQEGQKDQAARVQEEEEVTESFPSPYYRQEEQGILSNTIATAGASLRAPHSKSAGRRVGFPGSPSSALLQEESSARIAVEQEHPKWPYPDRDLRLVQKKVEMIEAQQKPPPVDDEDDSLAAPLALLGSYKDPDKEDATRDDFIESDLIRAESEDSPGARYISMVGENADNDDDEAFM